MCNCKASAEAAAKSIVKTGGMTIVRDKTPLLKKHRIAASGSRCAMQATPDKKEAESSENSSSHCLQCASSAVHRVSLLHRRQEMQLGPGWLEEGHRQTSGQPCHNIGLARALHTWAKCEMETTMSREGNSKCTNCVADVVERCCKDGRPTLLYCWYMSEVEENHHEICTNGKVEGQNQSRSLQTAAEKLSRRKLASCPHGAWQGWGAYETKEFD